MLMSGEFYLTIPYQGDTGSANRTTLKIGTFQFPYVSWAIGGYEFEAGDTLYLRIPAGYIDGLVRSVSCDEEYVLIQFDGTWSGKYDGLLYGKCAYGEFHVYPQTGIVYDSMFFPEGYDWAIPLELYHLISSVARYKNLRPSQKLSMDKFIELCFAAGMHYASQNFGQTVVGLDKEISRLVTKIPSLSEV